MAARAPRPVPATPPSPFRAAAPPQLQGLLGTERARGAEEQRLAMTEATLARLRKELRRALRAKEQAAEERDSVLESYSRLLTEVEGLQVPPPRRRGPRALPRRPTGEPTLTAVRAPMPRRLGPLKPGSESWEAGEPAERQQGPPAPHRAPAGGEGPGPWRRLRVAVALPDCSRV